MKQRTILAACVGIAMAAILMPPAAIGATALDAGAPAPALSYRSAFDAYRPFDDVEPKAWRALNDTVRHVGGHAGALKSAGDAPAQAAPAGMKPPVGATPREPPGGAAR